MATLRELLTPVRNKLTLNEFVNLKKKKLKHKTKKSNYDASSEKKALTIEALSTLMLMTKNNALTESEIIELRSSIEAVFNNVLAEDINTYTCTNDDCGWEGTTDEMTEVGICPLCGDTATVDEDYSDEDEDYSDEDEDYSDEDEDYSDEDEDYSDEDEDYSDEDEDYSDEDYSDEDEDMEESILHKTSTINKKHAKAYRKTAEGKKSLKLSTKKRAKYATLISRCSENGKTFSFKTMSCIKANKRR